MVQHTRKIWLNELLEKADQIEEAIQTPIGRLLGCGHYGCVFESESPWVVKITVDPNEGPMVRALADFAERETYAGEAAGFVRVRSVTRILPDVGKGKTKRPVYVIVREDVAPLIAGTRGDFSEETRNRYPSLPENVHLVDMRRLGSSQFWDLHSTLRGLRKYREVAEDRRLRRSRNRSVAPRYVDPGTEEERVDRACHLMIGPAGDALGNFLRALYYSKNVLLEDVHLGNVGWRIHEGIAPWGEYQEGLVVFDPGHTPTDRGIAGIEERLIRNGRMTWDW
jgi:hypothetical protein